jgi:hypothetical protein
LTAWLVRRYGAGQLGAGAARGRQPRLAVIDAAAVDGRRRRVLIRRDNTEHLLMIGGPTDVVVEQNIVRGLSLRESNREAARAASTSVDTPARPSTSSENGAWPLAPVSEPATASTSAARPYRSTLTDEPWLSQNDAGTRSRLPPDQLSGLAAELSVRITPQPDLGMPLGRLTPATESARSESATAGAQDGNLAEMAQRLEAALRRPPQNEGRPPVTDPLAVPPESEPSRAKYTNGSRPHAAEPKLPNADSKAAAKRLYDNLEQEMASLLGRPTNRP